MTERNGPSRQAGWRILVATTAVTMSGGVAVVHAADTSQTAPVTLDDVVPMVELAAPVPLAPSGERILVEVVDRYDAPASQLVRGTASTDQVVTVADASPTPNTPNTPNSPDPTPNTPDPTPNTPDPTPNSPDPTPDSPDPSPNTPDPTPNSPDPTPDSPDPSPDVSPESPD